MMETDLITYDELLHRISMANIRALSLWELTDGHGYDQRELIEHTTLDHCYPSELPAMCQPQAL